MSRPSRSSYPSPRLPSEVDYVERLLALYVSMPHTPSRPRQRDRLFAARLSLQGVPFTVVRQGLLLASLRRLCRDSSAPRLDPIRTLRYFEGAIVEALSEPADDVYIRYLEAKLRRMCPSPTVTPTKPRPSLGAGYVQLPLPL
jgi:hypothetical protein